MKHKSLAYAIKATLPVLTGYLAAGFAFGLMYNQIGYNPGFAALTSATLYHHRQFPPHLIRHLHDR